MKKYKYSKNITIDGKVYKIRADTKEELAVKEYKKRQDVENGVKKIEKNMLFRDWCAEWLETYKEPSVSKETYDGYVSRIRCHILPTLGNMRLKDIKSLHIQKIINDIGSGSREMIDKVAYTVHQILEDARRNGLLIDNPAENITKPKGTVTSRRAITPSERRHILHTAETHRAGTWIYLMLYAGLRPAEACALQWRHIDFNRRLLKVEGSVKRSGHVGEPKTAAGKRSIPISKPLHDRLMTEKKQRLQAGPFDYVVINTKGEMVNASSMRKMWISFRNALNVDMGCSTFRGRPVPPYRVADDLVPYCLRHTFCTDLQAAGVPINVARELMGHTDISVTSKIYTHSTEEATHAALLKMDGYHKDTRACVVTPAGTPTAQNIENTTF